MNKYANGVLTPMTKEEIDKHKASQPTEVEITDKLENDRKFAITEKATSIIEAKYSPLKQRKMMSIAIALQDKQLQGLTLTSDEEALLQFNRDVNIWITSIRTIENIAIEDNIAIDDINWEI